MMKRVMATAIAFATVAGAIGTASAHSPRQKGIEQIDTYGNVTVVRPQPNDVWIGNELAGRDPDPNVRLQLLRDFGNL